MTIRDAIRISRVPDGTWIAVRHKAYPGSKNNIFVEACRLVDGDLRDTIGGPCSSSLDNEIEGFELWPPDTSILTVFVTGR